MLIDYCPPVVKRIQEIKEICRAEQPEFDAADKETERLLLNMFITTSDVYGMARMEEELGIVPVPGQSLEERRVMILVRAAKKSLSLRDIRNMIQNYSTEIELLPDYDKGELEVAVGIMVDNLRLIYKMLDEISGLNIYIYFSCAVIILSAIMEPDKMIELETAIHGWTDTGKQTVEAELETLTEITERFQETSVISQKDLWRLNGLIKLNGSRKLDAKEIKEEI